MSFQKCIQTLTAAKDPIVFVFGDELFQKHQILESLKKSGQAVKMGEASQADEKMFEEDWFSQDLFNPLECLVYFDSQKLVNKKFVEKFLRTPLEGKRVVFFFPKMDKKKFKDLETDFPCFEIRDPYDREWKTWRSYFEKMLSVSIEESLWEALGLWYQKGLKIVEQELRKLSLYSLDAKLLKLADYESLTLGKISNIFDWVEAVALKDKQKAVALYHLLKREEESEVKMLSLLVRQFEILLKLSKCKAEGITDPKVLGSRVGLHSFFLTGIEKQARLYTNQSLIQNLEKLSDVDYNLKLGRGNLFSDFLIGI